MAQLGEKIWFSNIGEDVHQPHDPRHLCGTSRSHRIAVRREAGRILGRSLWSSVVDGGSGSETWRREIVERALEVQLQTFYVLSADIEAWKGKRAHFTLTYVETKFGAD